VGQPSSFDLLSHWVRLAHHIKAMLQPCGCLRLIPAALVRDTERNQRSLAEREAI